MPVCANQSLCPGVCVVPKAGSTFFKTRMSDELALAGTAMVVENDCQTVHCARFPWPQWTAVARAVRIVRHPAARLLSGYLDGRHLRLSDGSSDRLSRNDSFGRVVWSVTGLPDTAVNPHLRRQGAMCATPASASRQILRLEEYHLWRLWLVAELGWRSSALPLAPLPQSQSDARMDEFYTPGLLTRVELWSAADMRAFGYVRQKRYWGGPPWSSVAV